MHKEIKPSSFLYFTIGMFFLILSAVIIYAVFIYPSQQYDECAKNYIGPYQFTTQEEIYAACHKR